MQVCKKCKHLIDPTEVHECPSEAYTQERNSLVSDACEAEKVFTDEELEESTYKIVRIHGKTDKRRTLKTGLTLEEAKEHCSDRSTTGTDVDGPWMDCFYEE